MNFDERLKKLAERQQALAEKLKMTRHEIQEQHERLKRLEERARQGRLALQKAIRAYLKE